MTTKNDQAGDSLNLTLQGEFLILICIFVCI